MLSTVVCGLGGRSDASFPERRHEHAHQERRPARCSQASVDEHRMRSLGETQLDELGDCCSCQRGERDDIGGGVCRHARKQLGIGAGLAWAGRQN
jgi:hypothetical protein